MSLSGHRKDNNPPVWKKWDDSLPHKNGTSQQQKSLVHAMRGNQTRIFKMALCFSVLRKSSVLRLRALLGVPAVNQVLHNVTKLCKLLWRTGGDAFLNEKAARVHQTQLQVFTQKIRPIGG
jgi:hypothetical protein